MTRRRLCAELRDTRCAIRRNVFTNKVIARKWKWIRVARFARREEIFRVILVSFPFRFRYFSPSLFDEFWSDARTNGLDAWVWCGLGILRAIFVFSSFGFIFEILKFRYWISECLYIRFTYNNTDGVNKWILYYIKTIYNKELLGWNVD